MARKIGPRLKHSRRFGAPLFGTAKEAKILARRGYGPGQHGAEGNRRTSGYGLQLREKQKAKLIYGLLERQFRKYFEEMRSKTGDTGELLLQALERRLDNVIYRLGLATTRAQARQLVGHGHIHVNGKLVDIPSFRAGIGDTITIRPQSESKKYFEPIKKYLETYTPPAWLELDKSTLTGKVLALPTKEDTDRSIDLQLIVEFYSR
ncbi:MAG: 30S ribosomal protein S4 [Candidatus Kerfeldbacteria bacterium]|nr:30S ribosomal protein S4 [Candidatus Kerfeldbacteria bacterium]